MSDHRISKKLCVFVSSVQNELEDERLIVQNLVTPAVGRNRDLDLQFVWRGKMEKEIPS